MKEDTIHEKRPIKEPTVHGKRRIKGGKRRIKGEFDPALARQTIRDLIHDHRFDIRKNK